MIKKKLCGHINIYLQCVHYYEVNCFNARCVNDLLNKQKHYRRARPTNKWSTPPLLIQSFTYFCGKMLKITSCFHVNIYFPWEPLCPVESKKMQLNFSIKLVLWINLRPVENQTPLSYKGFSFAITFICVRVK